MFNCFDLSTKKAKSKSYCTFLTYSEQNLDDSQGKEKQPKVFQLIFIVPTIMDLLGTTFGGIGLVYVSASIWQMLRGSIIIFTGVLSVFSFYYSFLVDLLEA